MKTPSGLVRDIIDWNLHQDIAPQPPLPRVRKLPQKFNDFIPEGPSRNLVPSDHPALRVPIENPILDASPIPPLKTFRTETNRFGVFREYLGQPPTPVLDQSIDNISIGPTVSSMKPLLYPFPNRTTLDIYHYHIGGSSLKSKGELENLVDLLTNPTFTNNDLINVNFKAIETRLDEMLKDESHDPRYRGLGWKHGALRIQIPVTKQKPIDFEVPGLHYRSILKVVKDAVEKVQLSHCNCVNT